MRIFGSDSAEAHAALNLSLILPCRTVNCHSFGRLSTHPDVIAPLFLDGRRAAQPLKIPECSAKAKFGCPGPVRSPK